MRDTEEANSTTYVERLKEWQTPSAEQYRLEIREQLEDMTPVRVIDSVNHMTRIIAERGVKPMYHNILVEEHVRWLDQHYPTTNLRHTRVHS